MEPRQAVTALAADRRVDDLDVQPPEVQSKEKVMAKNGGSPKLDYLGLIVKELTDGPVGQDFARLAAAGLRPGLHEGRAASLA
jgi:hypothetical protein